MFYCYGQNNSGGVFEITNDVTLNVVIEADSPDQADAKAEEIGIYFDGCELGIDCPCCGDRWSPMYDNGEETHEAFLPAEDSADCLAWTEEGEPHTIVYFANGTVKRYFA